MRTGDLINGQISYLDPHRGYREPEEEPASELDPDIILDPELSVDVVRDIFRIGRK